MLPDIACKAERSPCGERTHEGVKLWRHWGARGERKSRSNREQFVLNEAFDFPALENPMLSGRQTRGLGGLLARYAARLVTQKRTVILSCLWLLSLLKTDSRTNWKLDSPSFIINSLHLSSISREGVLLYWISSLEWCGCGQEAETGSAFWSPQIKICTKM